MLALCARDPTEHHFGAQRSDRCNPIIKEIVMTFDIDTFESDAQSVTATVCENAALYGATPERGEFDSREVWDADDATDAVSEAFRILAEGVAPDGFQLADERESLLWGFVNCFDAQVRRLDRSVDRLSPELRDLQKAQDGTEIKSRELELVTDRARNLGDRRDAFEIGCATPWPTQYREETGDTWRPEARQPRQPDRQADLGGHRRPRFRPREEGPRDHGAPARRGRWSRSPAARTSPIRPR